MKVSTIHISKMDCPSEIKMIEGLFENIDQNIKMEFDLNIREVKFYHSSDVSSILDSLNSISLPGTVTSSSDIDEKDIPDVAQSVESKTLIYLLAINFTMFLVEIIAGFIADSTGLLADGLDMLADSFVYGISLYAVGKAISMKRKAAYFSGLVQITLGALCIFEVARKVIYGSEPLSSYMVLISFIALIANVSCLFLIHKYKDGEVHMKASWIFSANDVLVNSGVIISGLLVYLFKSNLPDLIIGGFVSLVVIKGGITIIKLSKPQNSNCSNACGDSK